jgi:hypothetical protein
MEGMRERQDVLHKDIFNSSSKSFLNLGIRKLFADCFILCFGLYLTIAFDILYVCQPPLKVALEVRNRKIGRAKMQKTPGPKDARLLTPLQSRTEKSLSSGCSRLGTRVSGVPREVWGVQTHAHPEIPMF